LGIPGLLVRTGKGSDGERRLAAANDLRWEVADDLARAADRILETPPAPDHFS
jgi:hypothetical protein